MTSIKTTIKIKKPKPIIDKTFRLIDFHVCDDTTESIDQETAQFKQIQEKAERERRFPGYVGPARTHKGHQDRQFLIRMFGINETGETVSLCITDYQPFFFVKVGDGWTKAVVDDFKMSLIAKSGGKGVSEILGATLVKHNKLYGFSDFKKYNFVKMTFRTVAAMNRIKNCWYKQTESRNTDARYTSTRTLSHYMYRNTPTTLYESNIPPLLRYFHIHNISPSGWIRIKTTHAKPVGIDYRTTTCTHEYICEKSAIEPLPTKETAVPYKICSFDIEASSSHGDFPLPVKTYKRLASNMVDVFIRQFQSQSLDATKSAMLVRKIVRAAFGFGTFDDVDLVYPKTRVSLKTAETGRVGIDDLLEKMLATAVANAKTLDITGEASNILTIHAAFDKLRESEDKLRESEDKLREADAVGAAAEGDDADEDSDSEMAETPAFKKYKKPAAKMDVRTKLVDVLMSDKYSRDEKIQIADQMLTSAFPPLRGDETTFIGSTFLRYGETEPYLNNCIVAGSCDPVPGTEIVAVETERDLLLAWTRLIQRENPDIIIGYNIFGFDYEFLFRRALETGCERDFLMLSRKRGELCAKTVIPKSVQKPQEMDDDDDDDTESGDESGLDEPATPLEEPKKEQLDIEHTTVQLASGEYDLKYFRMSGRLQVDMYTYFRRDFNLSSYKLDDVAGQFINDEIKKIEQHGDDASGDETTWLYSSNLTGLHVGDFIHIELTGFTSDYYQNGRKFQVLRIMKDHEIMEKAKDGTMKPAKYNVVVIAGHHSVGDYKSIRWGMAKDDITPQDIFRLSKGSAADRALVAKYCIQDCNLVHHLMNKIDVITGYVEMSRICSVPISFLVFRGQGIKLTSYVAKKCREKDTLMPDLDKSGSNEGYEGAIVLPPKCSMYMDNPVACVDYASLYPSSMISNNLSHDSKVWTIEYDLTGNKIKETGEKDRATGKFVYDELPGYEYIDIEFDTYRYVRKTPTSRAEKVKSGMMVCRWAQFPEGKKGIMPAILEELLKARSDTRKFAKTVADPFMANILDKRQLAYKVTANSLYGQCGAKTSTFYEKDVAASTTATGRKMITYARRIIEEVYGDREYETTKHGVVLTKAEYVYGDSVASYTPVYIRMAGGQTEVCTIESLADKYGVDGWRSCLEPGKQTKEVCEMRDGVETWTEKGWTKLHRVIRHELAPHKKMVRVLTHTGLVDATDDHSLLTPDGREVSPKDVSIGDELLHAPLPSPPVITAWKPNTIYDSQLEAAIAYFNGSRPCRIQPLNHKKYMLIECSTESMRRNKIIDLHTIQYTGFVYDLTTENHHFAAGIGKMVVHNTDSVFFTFNLHDPKTGDKIRGHKALEITIEIAQDAAHLCTKFLKPPMELAYEKTLMPFVLLSKKRYVGMLYETDPNKGKLKYMGLSLKRRDSCDYLKDTYGGILNVLMKENNVEKATQFLDQSISRLIDGNVPMDKLMITKALRSDYKNPQQIAHKVLADRIGKRDPGNKPKPGDRIKFLHVVSSNAKALQGEKIETPEFIIDNKVPIDYAFYITNQLMKPLQQLFGLALEQIWENQNKTGPLSKFRKDMIALQKEFPDLEVFMKKKEKYCSQKIKTLLFDKFLTKIQNARAGNQEITAMFPKKQGNPMVL